MSNIENKKYFGKKDPKFEIFKQLMHDEALIWAEQPGANYHELLRKVFRNYEKAYASEGEIVIPDNDTQPVFVDASGEFPRVVEGSDEVELNKMYTDLFGFTEDAPYDNSPVHHSGRR